MSYKWTILGNAITRTYDGAIIPIDADNIDYIDTMAWVAAGNTIAQADIPAPTQQEYSAAIQHHVDATAQSRGYADGVALASYVSSCVSEWASEAMSFSEWRDAVWVYAYQQLAAVQAGQRTAPTVAEFIAELPAISYSVDGGLQQALNRIENLENSLGEFVARIDGGNP